MKQDEHLTNLKDTSAEASDSKADSDDIVGYQSFPDFVDWPGLPSSESEAWTVKVSQLEERRQGAKPEVLEKARTAALRAAALDSGALEGLYTVDRGFTMTVAQQVGAWEMALREKSDSALDLFGAQLEALELVMDAATGATPIVEAWIRRLHEVVCSPQETYLVMTDSGWQRKRLEKGAYKTEPNNPYSEAGHRLHTYAPVIQVPSEMHRLITQIESSEFERAHPVLQASYVHYGLAVIHPFADGNGRMARAIASIYLLRAARIPLLVFADQKKEYLDALEEADRGNRPALVRFFFDRAIDAMSLIHETLLTASRPTVRELASKLEGLVAAPGDLSKSEITALVTRSLQSAGSRLNELVGRLNIRGGVDLRYGIDDSDNRGAPAGYRRVVVASHGEAKILRVRLQSGVDQSAGVDGQIRIMVSLGDTAFPLLFEWRVNLGSAPTETLDVRLSEVHPLERPSFRVRLEAWLERFLGHMLEALISLLDDARRRET